MTNNKICSIVGCGKPLKAGRRLYCSMHAERQRRGISMQAERIISDPKLISEFFESLERGVRECIIWPFGRSPDGYALHYSGGYDSRLVHRNVCIKFNGFPSYPATDAAHICGNGNLGCVNPDHLEWKSHAANMADMILHGTSPKGSRNGQSRLTASAVMQMRELRKSGETYEELSKRFSVSISTAFNACSGKTWSHI